jgi:hypothetical protein
MSFHDTGLLEFARQMQRGQPAGAASLRASLEASLLPIVRVAMRGVGHPHVVQWAREETRSPGAPPPRELARRLCDRLMERLDPVSGRETVAGL